MNLLIMIWLEVAGKADIRNPREIVEQISEVIVRWKQYAIATEVAQPIIPVRFRKI